MMNEIVPGLFVGDFQDTVDRPYDFASINVAYEHMRSLPDSLYLPWLGPVQGGFTQGGLQVNKIILDASAEIIDLYLKAGKKVLVNCNMGVERSPLTVVWFLTKKRGMTLDSAYELVKKQRPQTQDRRQWVASFL